MLHNPSCFISNRKHISIEPRKSQLGNKYRVVAIVGSLANCWKFFPDDPFTYHEALQSLDVAHWVHAMTDEIHSLK